MNLGCSMAKLEEWSYTGGKNISTVTTATVVESAEAMASRWARQRYTPEEWAEKQRQYQAWAREIGVSEDGSTFGASELGL